jgi:putative tricarboxylic transport membrane protein
MRAPPWAPGHEGAGPVRAPASDRLAGGGILLLAALVAWESRRFVVGFPADPVGPRALPLFAAALLAASATGLLLRPAPDPRWPEPHLAGRLGAAVLLLLVYPLLLPLVGFTALTGAVVGLLSLLFGGPPLRSFAAAFAFAGGLYLLFVHLLAVPLPIGELFLARDG